MPAENHAWPADERAMRRAREFLEAAARGTTLIAPDGDADGLCAGMLVHRFLVRRGGRARPALQGKGEHVHHPAMRERLRRAAAAALVATDMGSRGEPIVAGLPTLVIDHHQPRGMPPGAEVLSSFGHEPVATTSLLTFSLLSTLDDVSELEWLGVLGTVGDLGADAPFDGFGALVKRYGRKNLTAAVALLNAPRRSAAHGIDTAWRVLERAGSPADIARGRVEGVEELRERRAETAAEVARCSAIAPRFAGHFALISMRSGAKVHPLVARRWMGRLAGKIVVAANADYLPGRVNFAMRTTREVNLIELLRGLGVPLDQDVGYGHPQATGGSLAFEDFARLLVAMGFSPAFAREETGAGAGEGV